MFSIKRSMLLVIVPLSMAIHCNKSDKTGDTEVGPVNIRDEILTQNLNHPWEILWGPDQFIWMTERGGRISRVNPNSGVVTTVFNVPDVVTSGEGGLLGMVLHPQFETTPHVFIVYNHSAGGDYQEKVVRYTYNGTTLINPIIIISGIQAASIHDGSRLLIINNKLFITTGDAANTSLPQDISSVNGKVLRLNLDGTVPSDNPVPGNPYWSYGHRNAQGLVYANNMFYSSEHGPNDDDEINIIEKGRNYGWPQVHGFCDEVNEQDFCSRANVKEPIKAWTPTIATCGLDYYNHPAIPQWKNSLLLATLKDARIYQMKLDSSNKNIAETHQYLINDYGRLRDICISPAGKVYVCTSNGGGNDKIIVIEAQ